MSRRIRSLAELSALPIVLVALWWAISANSTSVFFPPLPDILKALVDWAPTGLREDVLPSLRNLLLGYALAVLVGVAVGTLLGRVRLLGVAFSPILEFSRSIPPAALLPFFILAMGPNDRMRIAVIAVGSLWPTLLATVDGIRGIEPAVLDTARIYRISRRRRLFKVYLPAASPLILTGMKTTLAFSVILVVVSEMLASTHGIGYYIISSQQYFNLPDLWAGTIVMGLLGYLLSEIFFAVERRLLAWKGDA
jgi:ABC-type nitrate/sulfonate/bicarbonate transport system permease component